MQGWESDEGDDSSSPPGEAFVRKRLVELKAHIDSPEATGQRLRALGAVYRSTLRQRDVYFLGVRGRLKLRLQSPGRDVLVQYDRGDSASTKESRVRLCVLTPNHGLEPVLSAALGVSVVVSKRREVFDWDGTRVHVDRVESLGSFLEFERPVTSDREATTAHTSLRSLLARLGIPSEALEAGSYSDLLRSLAHKGPSD